MNKVILVDNETIKYMQNRPNQTVYRAYKVFAKHPTKKGVGMPPIWHSGRAKYYKLRNGEVYTESKCNTNPRNDCGKGLHVCTLAWAIDKWWPQERSKLAMWLVEFTVADIAAVPYGVYACKVVDEIKFKDKFRVKKFTLVKRVAWPKD